MSEPTGALWVDPEGVLSVSRAYDGHIAMYDRYLSRLDHLRTQYASAWGDDEIGNQFRKQFDNTMDVVEGIILGVRGSVEYAAVGLRISGEGYRQAEDDAIEAGRVIGGEFSALPTQVAVHQPSELTPQYASHQPTLSAVEAAPLAPTHTALTPHLPADPGVAPTLTPTMPLASRHLSHPTEGVLIDGVPVPEGFQLRTLNTFADGTSRLDVSYYDSVLPLGDRHVVTGSDGQPLNPDGGHLFLIRPQENPVDPASPDYQRMVVGFAADGTVVPL